MFGIVNRDTEEQQCLRLPDLLKFHENFNAIYDGEPPDFPFENINDPKKELRKLFSNTDSRLTISRVERYMTLVAAGKYEATQATYLFSKFLSSSSARRYYTALSFNHYRYMYKDICQSVLNSIESNNTLEINIDINDTFLGARYCPETEHVKQVLIKLDKQLKELREKLLDEHFSWIDFHNFYTAYCVYSQGFLTGIRAVISPPESINSELKIAVFRDKDSDDQFHTRIIPLHPLIVKFSDAYKNHRHAVLVRLAALNPSSTIELRLDEQSPFVFFLNEKGLWKHVRPSCVSQLLTDVTDLPLNSNRKLLRTLLLEQGVSAHAVDTMLGHASRGEPFWGACATRSFQEISVEIISGLTQIKKEIGLDIIEGLNV